MECRGAAERKINGRKGAHVEEGKKREKERASGKMEKETDRREEGRKEGEWEGAC